MKTNKQHVAVIATSLLAMACSTKPKNGEALLTAPLDDSVWSMSEWISAADAPVVTGKVEDNVNNRAADGASWFLCTVKNEKKVTKALWQTTGLGIYHLYANGKTVGKEILKPGFTHHEKTIRYFVISL